MSYSQATKEDIVDGEPIDIAAKVLQQRTFDDGNTQILLEDIEGEQLELKIWAGDLETDGLEDGEWYCFENAEGDIYNGKVGLGSNRGELELRHLPEPPEDAVIEQEQKGAIEQVEGDVVALDIETISQVSEAEFDFENSDHVELLCIGVGYTPSLGMPGTSEVLFRSGMTPATETALLEEFCGYVEARDPDQLVMFKGDFDRRHLLGRAKRLVDVESGLDARVEALFAEREVVNLDPWGSLEENASVLPTFWDIYDHSLDPAEWRTDHPRYSGDLSDPKVTNADIPYFGERYLELCEDDTDGGEQRALRELLRHYTVADIDPLFELVD